MPYFVTAFPILLPRSRSFYIALIDHFSVSFDLFRQFFSFGKLSEKVPYLLQHQIYGLQLYWNWILQLMFFLGVLQILPQHYFQWYFRAVGSMLRLYNLMPVYLMPLKNSCCKTFRKNAENPGKDCNFLLLSGFSFEFCEIFINSRFSEKVGKKKVLGRSSFDNFFFDSFTYK